MKINPRTPEDKMAIIRAMGNLEGIAIVRSDETFRDMLLAGGLELLMSRHLFLCGSFQGFIEWLESEDRGEESLRWLIDRMDLRAAAEEILLKFEKAYSDQDSFNLSKEAVKGGAKQPAGTFTLEVATIILQGHLYRSESFDDFFGWLGSEDHAAQWIKGMIEASGLRREIGSLVKSWRLLLGFNQELFDRKKKWHGRIEKI